MEKQTLEEELAHQFSLCFPRLFTVEMDFLFSIEQFAASIFSSRYYNKSCPQLLFESVCQVPLFSILSSPLLVGSQLGANVGFDGPLPGEKK